MEAEQEKKKILTLRVKNNIKAKDWIKLTGTLPVAEEAGINTKLLLRSYLLLGEYFKSKKPYTDAVIYYFKAISITNDESVYKNLVGSFRSFYKLFENEFSNSDLQYLQTFLRSLYNKTASAFPNSLALLNAIKSFITEVKDLEETSAKNIIESTASFEVSKIYNGFYRPKNPQEVFEHFSDIISANFQEFYDDELSKEPDSKKQKKKKHKKKKDKKE